LPLCPPHPGQTDISFLSEERKGVCLVSEKVRALRLEVKEATQVFNSEKI
jgi:hypothetical protein